MKSTPVLYTGNFLPVYTIFHLIFFRIKVWGVDLHFGPTYMPFFTVLQHSIQAGYAGQNLHEVTF